MVGVSGILYDAGHILIIYACLLSYTFFLKCFPSTFFIHHQCAIKECCTEVVEAATCNKKPVIGYYCDKIHTGKDTVCEQVNLDFIAGGLSDFVARL